MSNWHFKNQYSLFFRAILASQQNWAGSTQSSHMPGPPRPTSSRTVNIHQQNGIFVTMVSMNLYCRKSRGTRDQIANICWITEKARDSRKTSISALLTMPKPLTMWITTNCGKFWKRWEYQATWPVSWEICMQVKKQQLELDMEQQTGSK